MNNQSSNIPEVIAGGIVNNKATNLVEPELASKVTKSGFSGKVNVEVLIDENGNVISATYVSGNSALKFESEEAARQSKFAPTSLLSKSVKVRGVIVYNVSAQ